MTLTKGDHLVIMRDGKIVEGESYHEFEVISEPLYMGTIMEKAHYIVTLEVVK